MTNEFVKHTHKMQIMEKSSQTALSSFWYIDIQTFAIVADCFIPLTRVSDKAIEEVKMS
jgi:hypothetical protein